RPCVVHRARARVAVEEAAHGLVDVILVMSQDLLVRVRRAVAIGEALFRLGRGQAEVSRQALDVEVAHRNARVTAAIPGTLETVVARHDAALSKVTKVNAY